MPPMPPPAQTPAPPPPPPPRPARPPAPCLQAELLHGQKLQGTLTAEEVAVILQRRGWEAEYPLFTTGGGG